MLSFVKLEYVTNITSHSLISFSYLKTDKSINVALNPHKYVLSTSIWICFLI